MLGLSAGLGGIYEVGRIAENKRYWETYRKNTGVTPRYPYRTGFNNLGGYASALGRIGFASSLYRPWNDPVPDYGYWSYDIGYMYR